MMPPRLERVRRAWKALRADLSQIPAQNRGVLGPFGDASAWALTFYRGGSIAQALCGSTLGCSMILRLVFRIDIWTDQIGPGLRLPHPFEVVIGEGVRLGAGCVVMHGVTIQRSSETTLGSGVMIGTGSAILDGAHVGDGARIGALSVVRGHVPNHATVVGVPARLTQSKGGSPKHADLTPQN